MDAIRRNLAQTDLPRRPCELAEYAADRIPLLIPAVGLIVGIEIQEQLHPAAWIWPLSGVILLGLTALAFYYKRTSPTFLMVGLSLCCLGVGAIRMANVTRIAPDDIRQALKDDPRLASIRGQIIRDIRIDDHDWFFKALRPVESSTCFYLSAREILTTTGWSPIQGILRVWVGEPINDLEIGDEVQVQGWLEALRPATNPGQFDMASYMLDQGVVAMETVKSRQGIELLPPTLGGLPIRIVLFIRQAAQQALSSRWPENPQALGLVQALLLGYRQDIDSRLYEAFRRTGLLHYVSLSGMHFCIVVGIVWWLAKTAGLLCVGRAAVCAMAVGVFLLAIPPTAPALRAGIICWIFCAGLLLRRQSHPMNSLALSAMILLLARPTHLFDASWQLSFACMMGIFTLSKPIERAFHDRTGNRLQPSLSDSTSASIRLLKRLACGVIALLAAGLGAWLGSTGILLYHFYGLTPMSVVWTIAVFPGIWVVMMLGLAKILVFFLIPPLGPLIASLLAGTTDGLIWAVKGLGAMDVSMMRIGHIGIAPILLYYTLLLTVLAAPFRRSIIRKGVVISLAIAVVAWIGWTKWHHIHRPDLILTCLDVGHGQAIVVHLPGSKDLLLDAGSMYKPDIGSRVVNPYLDYSGLSTLDATLISHADADHLNGLPEVLYRCRIRDIYADIGKNPPGSSKAGDLLLGFLDQQGMDLQPLSELPTDWGRGTEIFLLWPPAHRQPDRPITVGNDLSAVFLIRFAGRQILLCSDIERSAQRQLLRHYPNLKADVLVVPHHGSTATLSPDFIERLDPEVLICSCRTRPSMDCRLVQPKRDQTAFYTSRDGAVRIHVDQAGRLEVIPFWSRQQVSSGHSR